MVKKVPRYAELEGCHRNAAAMHLSLLWLGWACIIIIITKIRILIFTLSGSIVYSSRGGKLVVPDALKKADSIPDSVGRSQL